MTATRTPPAPPPAPPSKSPPASSPAATGPTRPATKVRLRPNIDEWTDIAFLGGLIAIGVFGFANAYGGSRYFIAGVVGAALGLAVAHVCARTRQPLLVVAAATMVVFFLFGGAVAVPDRAIAGFLPSIGVVTALIDGLVQGWVKLLTILPPAGSSGNLLTIPYISGLIAGVLSLTIASRSRRHLFAVLPPIIVLVLSILFGTSEPASVLLQGAVFGVVTIAWVSIKRRNDRRVGITVKRSRRWVGVVAMLLLAGLGAAVFGKSLPGAGTNERFVLRDKTTPPFDPRDYPSPLNGYRKYKDKALLKEKTLFTVTGVEPGDHLRLATLDTYDGVVYSVGSGPGTSGYFQRVGSSIPVGVPGKARTVTVQVGEYQDVWVPSEGALSSIEFLGSRKRAADLQDGFRYNTESGTAANQALLHTGDRYTMDVVIPAENRVGTGNAAAIQQSAPVFIDDVRTKGAEFAGSAGSAMDRVNAIVKSLKEEGAFSDGVGAPGELTSRPGHGAQRLGEMVAPGGQMVGNAEQYAPLAALMARYLGIPTRVVMGLKVPEGAGKSVELTGDNVDAWIEVAIEGAGWVAVTDLTNPDKKDTEKIKNPEPEPQQVTPPPPPPVLPPSEEDQTDPNKVKTNNKKVDCTKFEGDVAAGVTVPKECAGEGFHIPTAVFVAGGIALTPVLVVAAITALIALLKSRRRSRRQTQGPPTERIAGGWNEVTDLASDLGTPVPTISTRREAAAFIGNPAAVLLAGHADGEIFGSGDPDDVQVERYWTEVDVTRAAMVAELTRFEKWKALVSLSSLRASGSRRLASRKAVRRRDPGSARPQPVAPVEAVLR